MPVIKLETAKLDKSQKDKLAKEMTELAAEVMNLPKEAFYVFFNEYDLDNIGVGGGLLADRTQS